MSRNAPVPHPVCGHPMPKWAHRPSGPCAVCLKDIRREYLPPDKSKTWNDIRAERRPALEITDWVETHPARASRASPEYVAALLAYRKALFDITTAFPSPEHVVWPVMPVEEHYR